MELLQLQYFLVVAKYENMSMAAKELFIAQPAVSQSIARLERELGTVLFSREGKKIRLNEAGKHLQKKAMKLMKVIEEIESEMKQYSGMDKKQITIDLRSSSDRMSDIIISYQKLHPEIEFHLIQRPKDLLYQDQYDIRITSTIDSDAPGIILREEIGLMVPNSLFASEATTISIQEVLHLPFIGLEKGSPLRRITDYFCEQVGAEPKYHIESDSPALVRKLLEAGSGIAFFPRKTWKDMMNPQLGFYRIQEGPFERYIMMEIQEVAVKKEHINDFCSFLKERILEDQGER